MGKFVIKYGNSRKKISFWNQLITNLLGRTLLLHCLGLGGGAVLIGAANVNGVIAPQPAVPREHIGAQNT